MSSKERSVRFSTKKPIEHESFDYSDTGDFEKIMRMPLPKVVDDSRFDDLDLFTAASLGWEFVEKLASTSAISVAEKNANGWTPLMYSAYLGHMKVCEFLCSKSASLESTNDLGQTALMLAASCGSKEMAMFLLGRGASVNKQDKKGQSALHYATRYNQSSITECLVRAGCDCNLTDMNGMTPTLNACKVGNDATVSLLLKYKGDPNRVNNAGENGEMLAIEHPNVLKVLQSELTMNDLLKQLGLEKYISIFERDEITLGVFLKLTEKDLIDMGITLFGPKKKLMNVIKHYQQYGVIATEQDVVIAVTPVQESAKQEPHFVEPTTEIPFGHRQEILAVAEVQHGVENVSISQASKSSITVNLSDLTEQISVNTEARKLLTMVADKLPESKHHCQTVIQRLDGVFDKLKKTISSQN